MRLVLQFLALLRGYEQHSFPALAAFAIDSMRSEVSQELTLGGGGLRARDEPASG